MEKAAIPPNTTQGTDRQDTTNPDLNPDLITHRPGSHPVGAGIGAVAGGAVGAVAAAALVGSILGPIGTAVGALVGGLAGGLLGKEAAEQINPSVEHEHWEKEHTTRPYAASGTTFDQYAPAYKHGWESHVRYPGRSFEEVEPELANDWEKTGNSTQLKWEQARLAARDAWDRIDAKNRSNASGASIVAAGSAAQAAADWTSQPDAMAASPSAASAIGSSSATAIEKKIVSPQQVTHEMVETRAYYLFLSGSRGQDEDWFQAERELKNA